MFNHFLFTTISVLLLLSHPCQAPQEDKASNPNSLLIHNGKIYTMDETQPSAEAILTHGDTIIFVGAYSEAKKRSYPYSKALDLKGATLTPGFIESHAHFMGVGKWQYEIDLLSTKSFEALLDSVKAAIARIPKGSWILGRGWHQSKWDSMPKPLVQGFQTHEALSAIAPDHPVYLRHASGHAGYTNAAAMKIAGIDADSPDPEGGEIFRDEQGMPTGILNENAMFLVTKHIPEPDEATLLKYAELAQKTCLAEGITSFHDAGADSTTIALYEDFLNKEELDIRLYTMLDGWDTSLVKRKLAGSPSLNPMLTIRSIKLYADGALGSRGAWLLKPYDDMPSTVGHARMEMEKIGAIAEQGLDRGYQVCVHAIGDRANREVLDQFETAFEKNPEKAKDARFRIEHAQHLHPEDIPRFKTLGVIASMQGIHHASDRPWAIHRLGLERIINGAYVWQDLIQSGAKVINGTDAPVEPVSAVACFYASVTRKTLEGTPEGGYEPKQCMTREQALATYTRDAAYGAFQENKKGTIEAGKWADFTVFSKDLMTIPEDKILNTKILKTIVAGEVKYEVI
jgi:predicted amidohydrolase YtcJ